jgi:DhnA family fructose-bisphosphate aldolase class Ia
MVGETIRLKRLLSDGRNAVVVAVDHGEFFGPQPGLTDPAAVVRGLVEADGILTSPGMVAHCAPVFGKRGAPCLLVRLNWSSSYCFQWGYREARHAAVLDPSQALALGADLGLASLILKTGEERIDRDNVESFSRIAGAARAAGLPIVGEFYPCEAESLSPEQLHDQVSIVSRILGELGADAIKTFYTGKRFGEIVSAVPVPMLVLGAAKTEFDIQALELASDAVNAGARGVVFGRNVFQAPDPPRMLRALCLVVKEGYEPSLAARECGLGDRK